MAQSSFWWSLIQGAAGLPSPWVVFVLTMVIMAALSIPQIGLLQLGYYVYTSPLGIGRIMHELQRWQVGKKRHTSTQRVAKEGEPLAISVVPALADNYQYIALETVALRKQLVAKKPRPLAGASSSPGGDKAGSATTEESKRTCHAVVVDPCDAPRIMEEIEQLEKIYDCNVQIEALLLTHYHLDHVGGAGALLSAIAARNQPRPQVVAPADETGRIAVAVDIAAKDTLEDDQSPNPEQAALRAATRVDDLAGPKPPQGSLRFGEGMLVHPMCVGCHTPGHTAYALEWRCSSSRVRAKAAAEGVVLAGGGSGKGTGKKSGRGKGKGKDPAADTPAGGPSSAGGAAEGGIVRVDGTVNGLWGRSFLFSGDALFAGGVGRFFEGTALQLALSLLQIVRAGASPPGADEDEAADARGLREGVKPVGAGGKDEPHRMLLQQQRAVARHFAPTVLEGALGLWDPYSVASPTGEQEGSSGARDEVRDGVWRGWQGICSPLVEAGVDVDEVQVHPMAFDSTATSRLSRVAVLPGHEYTEENLRFARWAEPENVAVQAKVRWAAARRAGHFRCDEAVEAAREDREAREEEALEKLRGQKDLGEELRQRVVQELDEIRQRRNAKSESAAAEGDAKSSAPKGAEEEKTGAVADSSDEAPEPVGDPLQTVPSTLQEELLTNPFVRALVPGTWVAARMDLIAAMAEREEMTELGPLPEAARLPQAIKTAVIEAREKSNGEMVPLLQDIVREAREKGDDLAVQKEMLVKGVVARSVMRLWLLRTLKSANVHREASGVADWAGPSWAACEKHLREMEEHADAKRKELEEAVEASKGAAEAAQEVFGGASDEAERAAVGGDDVGSSDDSSDDGIVTPSVAGASSAGAGARGADTGQEQQAVDQEEEEEDEIDDTILDELNAQVPLD